MQNENAMNMACHLMYIYIDALEQGSSRLGISLDKF